VTKEDFTMSTVPNHALFDDAYAGTPPRETGKPSEPLAAAADRSASGLDFSEGGPKCWFAVIRRLG
jgi:hypothetical protein